MLEGATDYSGVKVKLMGSNIETTTGVDGNYVLSTPIGNHDGLIFNSTLFESKNYTSTITVTENGRYLVPTQELNQVKNSLQGVLKLNGIQEVSGLKVIIESIDGTYEQEVMVNPDGGWTFPEVPLGEYTLTFFRENDDEWETVTQSVSIIKGDPQEILPVSLRQFFVKINNSAEVTTSPTVALSIGATGAADMRVGIDDPLDGTWEKFAGKSRSPSLPRDLTRCMSVSGMKHKPSSTRSTIPSSSTPLHPSQRSLRTPRGKP